MTRRQSLKQTDLKTKNPIRIVVAGTLPPPVCGTTVSLQLLISELEAMAEAQPIVVNTSGIRGSGLLLPWKFLRMIGRLTMATARCDVVTLHLSPLAIPLLGPFALALGRCFGKPVVLRLFGGQDFRDFAGTSGRWQKWVASRVDRYLAQTHRLLKSAQDGGIENVEWYPTSRPDPGEGTPKKSGPCKRFVFLGWVKESKGVQLILEAARKLDGISVDVFGPFDGMSEQDFTDHENVAYRGMITPGEAVTKLREYDALLLPTHWEGEGYPGVILEAYLAEIPVITTNFRDIPEIVDSTCGMLIPTRSTDALRSAMQTMNTDDEGYRKLAEGAAVKGRQFTSRVWAEKLVEICREL